VASRSIGTTQRTHRTASPLRASLEQLADRPPGLVITAEADVLRDEGAPYADRIREAGVPVTADRFKPSSTTSSCSTPSPTPTPPGRHHRGHRHVQDDRGTNMRHGGSVADRILAHGYGPGQLSLRAESLTLGLIEMCGSPGGNDAFTVGQREAPPTPPHSRLVAGLLPSAAPPA